MNTVTTHDAVSPVTSGNDDPFHDLIVIGIGIAFVVMAIVILALTVLFTRGNLYGAPSLELPRVSTRGRPLAAALLRCV